MSALIEIWAASFGIGLALWFAALCLIYPFQILKQGVDQV